MSDPLQPSPAEVAARTLELATSLGAHVGAAGAVLYRMLHHLKAPMAVKDVASSRYVHVNAEMALLHGRDAASLIGQTDADLVGADAAATIRAADQAALSQSLPGISEHRIDRDGRRREFDVVRVAPPRIDGGPPRLVCSVWMETTGSHRREQQLANALRQIEQQQQTIETLQRQIQGTPLRDAPLVSFERPQFDDHLRRELDLSSREHREFALVSIELDPLAQGVEGTAAGTRVLEALARLLRGNTRAMDAACRVGEARFAVLLSGVGLATAHSRMEGLRRACATQIVVQDGRDLGFTISMGVASFPHTAQTQDELLRAAESAREQARARGGNHVALASIRFVA